MKTLFTDGLIYPMNDSKDSYKYLGIENDKIVYLGNEYPKIKFDKEISIKDKYIYPAFIDSHLHLIYSLVLSSSSFNICEIKDNGVYPNTIEGIKEKIVYYAKNNKSKLIIINQYITPAIKENRLPNKDELDKWGLNKEIVVFSIDGHSASLSSSLAKKLNIKTDDGIIGGIDYDMNQGLITSYISKKATLFTLIKGIKNFTNECYKYGIAKVCALDGEESENGKDQMLSIASYFAPKMDIKVRLYPQYHNYDVLNKYNKVMKDKRIGGCSKWELDGSVGSHSASFYHPYKNGTITETYYKSEYINEKIKEALENKIQHTCHAIGTKAIDEVVNAYKTNESLIPKDGPMPRIDHFEFPSNESKEFVKNNRIAVTIQPGYSYLDKRYIHSYTSYLNDDNLNNILKLKDFVNGGGIILGSSDSPVQGINPFEQMNGMVNYYLDDESIDMYEAVKAYTTNPFKVLDEDDGILKINGSATFIITDKDMIKTRKNEVDKISVKEIYIDGIKKKEIKNSILYGIKLLLKKKNKI